MIDTKALIYKALDARSAAYAPYSGFYVGAALLLSDGEVIKGANIENASYGCTICAERSAFCSAISQKRRDLRAIAIVGGEKDREIDAICTPCGICRQFMSEFCPPEFTVILYDGKEEHVTTLGKLLPYAFELKGE